MSDLLIRGLDAKTVRQLKMRAKNNGRSLQGEAKLILKHAAGDSISDALAAAERWRAKLGKRFGDSAALIRKDRAR